MNDINGQTGVSIKYMRFYSAEGYGKTNDVYINIWPEINASFNQLYEARYKFYILNAPITGLTISDQDNTEFKRIIPLPAFWDPFQPNLTIDFRFKHNSTIFYNNLYNAVCNDLNNRIHFELRENTEDIKSIYIKILVHINHTILAKDFLLTSNGFTIADIKDAIINLHNAPTVSTYSNNDVLNEIIQFLGTTGVQINEVIQFLLICKMSGDAGCVEFIKRLDKYRDVIDYDDKDTGTTKVLDLDTKTRPLTFIYTGDALCAANAIVNNVKCVFKAYPLLHESDAYFCQFLGNKYNLEKDLINFMAPYMPDIKQAHKYVKLPWELNALSRNDISNAVSTICMHLIAKEFNVPVNVATWPPPQSSDEFVRYVISISSMMTFKDRLNRIINNIISELKLNSIWRSQQHSAELPNISFIDAVHQHYNVAGFFNPLIDFFKETIVIPDETLRGPVYAHITKTIETRIKISIKESLQNFATPLLDQSRSHSQEVLIEDEDMGQEVEAPTQKSKSKKRTPSTKSKNPKAKTDSFVRKTPTIKKVKVYEDEEVDEEADFESSTETDDSNEEVFLPSPPGEIRKNPARKGRVKTYAPES
jgi:hypothetical protein